MADDSFAGKVFHVRTDSGKKPRWERKARFTVTPIPGVPADPDGHTVLDSGGKSELHLKVTCVAYNAAAFDDIAGVLASFSTLIYDDVTYTNIYLADVSSGQTYNKDPDQPVEYTMEFIG